jgi:hypothetical protein
MGDMVPLARLERAHLAITDFESAASTDSATEACGCVTGGSNTGKSPVATTALLARPEPPRNGQFVAQATTYA